MKSKKLFTFLLVLILAGITTELGVWQLHRAREEKASSHPVADEHLYQIGQVATPGQNLTATALNKLVVLNGHYLKSYIAPGQSMDPSKNLTTEGTSGQYVTRPATLDVRLFELEGTNNTILVVRGVLGSDSSGDFRQSKNSKTEVSISGRIYPRQSSDVTSATPGKGSEVITRLDPSLIVADAPGEIYDGYVVASSEKFSQSSIGSSNGSSKTGQEVILMKRLATPLIISSTAGFYWQHIAYVVIWWFFTLLILTLPFYNQLRRKFSMIENLSSLSTGAGRKNDE